MTAEEKRIAELEKMVEYLNVLLHLVLAQVGNEVTVDLAARDWRKVIQWEQEGSHVLLRLVDVSEVIAARAPLRPAIHLSVMTVPEKGNTTDCRMLFVSGASGLSCKNWEC